MRVGMREQIFLVEVVYHGTGEGQISFYFSSSYLWQCVLLCWAYLLLIVPDGSKVTEAVERQRFILARTFSRLSFVSSRFTHLFGLPSSRGVYSMADQDRGDLPQPPPDYPRSYRETITAGKHAGRIICTLCHTAIKPELIDRHERESELHNRNLSRRFAGEQTHAIRRNPQDNT